MRTQTASVSTGSSLILHWGNIAGTDKRLADLVSKDASLPFSESTHPFIECGWQPRVRFNPIIHSHLVLFRWSETPGAATATSHSVCVCRRDASSSRYIDGRNRKQKRKEKIKRRFVMRDWWGWPVSRFFFVWRYECHSLLFARIIQLEPKRN